MPHLTTLSHVINSEGHKRTLTLFIKSREHSPQCGGLSQIYNYMGGGGGVITHYFITCKLHGMQSAISPPASVVNYSSTASRGIDSKIFTIYKNTLLSWHEFYYCRFCFYSQEI